MDEHTTGTSGLQEDGDAPVLRQVRASIQAGDLSQAEALLDGLSDHGAQWHFLMGAVCYRKGWMDEAQRHYDAAARMGAGNSEYQSTADRMRSGSRYHPEGRPFGTLFAENLCVGLGAAFAFCEVCGTCGLFGGACWLCSQCAEGMPR